MAHKPRLAVWKFASCDGCQLSLLDCEDELLAVAAAVELAYFPEASSVMAKGPYDISLVEGSITTPHDVKRIQTIRRQSKFLIAIGACATTGGIQALRNFADVKDFVAAVYATPEYISTLATSTPIAAHVPVDFELNGCPLNKAQLLEVVSAYLAGRKPVIGAYSVAVVVNAANPIGNLTRAQVRDIFTGVIQNWKEVGGSDAPIHLYIRDPISGTHLGFRELAMENKPYADTPNLFTNYAAIVEAVARDAGGIGYSSIELENNAGVKPVSIGGIGPNAADVDKGNYPYARVLHLYTSKGHETPEALDFIQFVLSPQGQAVLTRTGYTPHS